MVWIELIWLRTGGSGELFEHGNESSDFIKCSEILEELIGWWLLKKNPAPWI
jgi:hypothetical protein